ncbi:MAG TPA: hypothetical protein VF546_00630 [Pyrinomonadaceae bacterium]|jgi:hypothetical protein
MTDYLWDKTGEPETDVQQLEELLGALRYEPRPLELPEDIVARTARGSFRARQSGQWQRWAVAASLLLTLLAGAWLVVRFQQRDTHREVAQQTETHAQDGQTAPAVATTPNVAAPPNVAVAPHVERVNYRRPARVSPRAGTQRRAPAVAPREQVARNAPTEEALLASLPPEQRAATEQVLLALRIASTRLNDAQRLVQEMSAPRRDDNK